MAQPRHGPHILHCDRHSASDEGEEGSVAAFEALLGQAVLHVVVLEEDELLVTSLGGVAPSEEGIGEAADDGRVLRQLGSGREGSSVLALRCFYKGGLLCVIVVVVDCVRRFVPFRLFVCPRVMFVVSAVSAVLLLLLLRVVSVVVQIVVVVVAAPSCPHCPPLRFPSPPSPPTRLAMRPRWM